MEAIETQGIKHISVRTHSSGSEISFRLSVSSTWLMDNPVRKKVKPETPVISLIAVVREMFHQMKCEELTFEPPEHEGFIDPELRIPVRSYQVCKESWVMPEDEEF